MRVPPGVTGKVIGVRVFVRREKINKQDQRKRIQEIDDRLEAQLASLRQYRKDMMVEIEGMKGPRKKEEEDHLNQFMKLMEKRDPARTPLARRKTSSRATSSRLQ